MELVFTLLVMTVVVLIIVALRLKRKNNSLQLSLNESDNTVVYWKRQYSLLKDRFNQETTNAEPIPEPAPEPEEVDPTTVIPQILEYKKLSFCGESCIYTDYGVTIPLLGIGPRGIWIEASYNEKNDADARYWYSENNAEEYVLDWEEVVECFPNHKHEIMMLGNEQYNFSYLTKPEYNS